MLQQGGLKPEQGAEPPGPLTLTTVIHNFGSDTPLNVFDIPPPQTHRQT